MEEFEQGRHINKDSSSCCTENRQGKVAKSGSGKTSCEITGKKKSCRDNGGLNQRVAVKVGLGSVLKEEVEAWAAGLHMVVRESVNSRRTQSFRCERMRESVSTGMVEAFQSGLGGK